MNYVEKDLIRAVREAQSDICETMRNIFYDIMSDPENKSLFVDDTGDYTELGTLTETFREELFVDGILKLKYCERHGNIHRINGLVTDTERRLINKVKEACPDDCLTLHNLILERKEKHHFYDSYGDPTPLGFLVNNILNELTFNGRLKTDLVMS